MPGIRTLITATLSLALGVSLGAGVAWAGDLSDPAFRAEVAKRFEGVTADSITPTPVEGLYQISKGGTIGYITADGRYLLEGQLIDLNTNVNLTARARQRYRVERLAKVPESNMIIFEATGRPDNPAQILTVFTDVDCPYCRRFHSRINQLLDAGIEVRYLAFPLAGPGTKSFLKAKKAWCADDPQQAITSAMQGKQLESEADCDAPVMAQYRLAGLELRMRGTPSIIAANGKVLSPGLPIPELIEKLRAIDRANEG